MCNQRGKEIFKKNLTNLLLLLILFAVQLSTHGQVPVGPAADYGDAPDRNIAQYITLDPDLVATFPSRFFSETDPGFILHQQPESSIRLGPDVTVEDNALLVDQDLDDGWIPSSFGVCSTVRLELFVQVPDEADGPFYLNALFDWNHDARWQGALRCTDTNEANTIGLPGEPPAVPIPLKGTTPEWAVQNLRLDQAPFNVGPGFSGDVVLPPILAGPLPGELWIRYTVTTEPVNETQFLPVGLGGLGWDGSGMFVGGETEDYFSCLLLDQSNVFGSCPGNVLLPQTDTPVDRNQPDQADLSVEIDDLSDPTISGQNLTWVLQVRNKGPSDSENVIVNNALPAGTTLVNTSTSQGSCTVSGIAVTCHLGTLRNGGLAEVRLTVQVPKSFPLPKLMNTALVSSGGTFDPNASNNQDTEITDIEAAKP